MSVIMYCYLYLIYTNALIYCYLHFVVCFSTLSRQASAQLLHVALSPSVASPDTLLHALEGMADTLVCIHINIIYVYGLHY